MPDYKKAFEILTHSFKLQFKNKHLMVQDNEQDEYYLSDNEYDCLNDCLNAEPDSMDKIIEEFKKLEYEIIKEENDHLEFHKSSYYETTLEIYKSLTFYPFTKYESNEHYLMSVELEELQLINRVLRLWGVEVC